MNAQDHRQVARRRPLYQRTADDLVEILEGMEPGAFLPSEPALAKQLGVSRATLREAMRNFEERGLIVRRQGVGTYVTRSPQILDVGLEVLESIETMASRIGIDVDMGDLIVRERKAEPDDACLFQIDDETTLMEVSRVILADDRPVAYLIDILPGNILPIEISESGFSGSVLDLLLIRGKQTLGFSRTEITAVSASPEIARQLNIQRGDGLLCLEACLYDEDGQVLDHSYSYFLPGPFRFHVVRRVGL